MTTPQVNLKKFLYSEKLKILWYRNKILAISTIKKLLFCFMKNVFHKLFYEVA